MPAEYITINNKSYEVIEDPCRHIVIEVENRLPKLSLRERLLINPFNGCSHRCLFCFKNEFFTNSTYRLFREKNIITVFSNMPEIIAQNAKDAKIYHEAYISLIADPFQPLNRKYKISERIMEELVKVNVPFVVCTKGIISDTGIELLKKCPKSFVEISIPCLDNKIKNQVSRGDSASVKELLVLFERLRAEKIKTVARIEPIYPYVTDNFEALTALIDKLKSFGVKEIISAILKIPICTMDSNLKRLAEIDPELLEKYRKLYNNSANGLLIADADYRKKVFAFMLKHCDSRDMVLRICMESLKEVN